MEETRLNRNSGVTLIELLVVLAIAAILAQIALPEFSDIMKNNRSAARVNELQTSLTFARTEAVKRNTPVILCKSTDRENCVNSGSDWQSGWIVFADVDQSGGPNEGEVLGTYGNASEQFSLTFSSTRVSYAGNGLATQGQDGLFTLCDDRGEVHAKGVIVTISGRPRLVVNNGGDDDTELVCS